MSNTTIASTITLAEAAAILDDKSTSIDVVLRVSEVLKARALRDNGRSSDRAAEFLASRGIHVRTLNGTARAARAALRSVPAPKAPKAARTDEEKRHTALRKQAWDWRASEFKAGRKVTVDEAYAKFGTHRAKAKS